jgi:hypothetical protein
MSKLAIWFGNMFSSNAGDTFVCTDSANFMVTGHFVRFKCPMLMNNVKDGIIDLKHYSYNATWNLFRYIYTHELKLKSFSIKEISELYDLSKKYEVKDFENDKFLCDVILEHFKDELFIENNMPACYDALITTKDMEDKTLFNWVVRELIQDLFDSYMRCEHEDHLLPNLDSDDDETTPEECQKDLEKDFDENFSKYMSLPEELKALMFTLPIQNMMMNRWLYPKSQLAQKEIPKLIKKEKDEEIESCKPRNKLSVKIDLSDDDEDDKIKLDIKPESDDEFEKALEKEESPVHNDKDEYEIIE